jgi:hypothetical protein
MKQEYKEYLVNQILAGVTRISIRGKKYFLQSPTKLEKCFAYEMYESALSDCRYEGFLTRKAAKSFLSSAAIFTREDNSSLDAWHKDIEEAQMQLYLSRLNSEKTKFLRKTLRKLRAMTKKAIEAKYCLDYSTDEGYALYIKTQFVIHAGLRHNNGTKVFTDTFSSEKDYKLIEIAMGEISKATLDERTLREIARTNPWRSYWSSSKEGVFGIPACDMSDTQRALILLTKMYDNAHENPEAPNEDVFEDDDLFDGWMTHVTRTRKKDQKQSEIDKMLSPKQRNAKELFVVTPDEKGAKEIDDLNDIQSKAVKRQRSKTIERLGTAIDAQFLDIKLERQKASNEGFKSHGKGK